ncbi:MAG: WD40 repeat domain-containing protein [Acidimicrobiia bacterium]
MPLQFGGAIDQMLLVGDYLIYAGGNGTFTLGSDLADPAEPVVGGPTFLIPGSGPSSAWVVGGYDPAWFAPFDGVTGLVGEQTQMNGLGFPLAGFDDGLLIAPNSPEINGRYVVWRPGGEPEPIDIELSPQAGLYTVSGQMAVSVSPGPLISVINIDTNEIVVMMPFDSGEGLVSGVCFSPDLSYLAVVSSTGPVQVFRLATKELVGTMTTSATNWGVGWTGPSQLAFVAETSSGTRLRLFDPATSFTVDVAQLAAPGEWRIATSGPVC